VDTLSSSGKNLVMAYYCVLYKIYNGGGGGSLCAGTYHLNLGNKVKGVVFFIAENQSIVDVFLNRWESITGQA
jgi:hypothetical protein